MKAGDEILESDILWMCVSCETCSERCPMGIDIAAVMDALRKLALERGASKQKGNVPLFNKAFLKTVQIFGRSYDMAMIAAYKAGSLKFMDDTEKFPTMLKKRKIALLPSFKGDRKTAKRIFQMAKLKKGDRQMKYGYFPGCSSESTARDMHESTLEVAKALGIELIEPKGWTCCGATAGHQTDKFLSVALPAVSLAKVKDDGLDMVVSCAACYNRMEVANHEIQNSDQMRKNVSEALGRDYDGSVNVKHFMEVILEDVGIEKIKESVKRSLNGMKIACYYGCLLVRPNAVTKLDDPENPTFLDKIVTALGAESLEWPHKVECCGGGLSISRTDVVVSLTDSILEMAQASDAQCIVVACPMCQVNLDLRQLDIKKQLGKEYNMPIIYITQLIGLCLGIDQEKLGLEKLMISPSKVIEAVKL